MSVLGNDDTATVRQLCSQALEPLLYLHSMKFLINANCIMWCKRAARRRCVLPYPQSNSIWSRVIGKGTSQSILDSRAQTASGPEKASNSPLDISHLVSQLNFCLLLLLSKPLLPWSLRSIFDGDVTLLGMKGRLQQYAQLNQANVLSGTPWLDTAQHNTAQHGNSTAQHGKHANMLTIIMCIVSVCAYTLSATYVKALDHAPLHICMHKSKAGIFIRTSFQMLV